MTNRATAQALDLVLFPQQPALKLIYDTAPIGLACLSPDCRYLQINQRLTEICGISVEDHLGRFVRDCVPGLADAVEQIVQSIMETGEPVIGVEVAGQRPDQVEERYWMTYWHPLRAPFGEIVAVNVVAEEITDRKRAEREIREAKEAAETALRDLRGAQDSLIESEKLASLGRMVAGVAHEINSPVGIGLTVASTLKYKAELFATEIAGGAVRRSAMNGFVDLVRSAATQLVLNLSRAADRVELFKQAAVDPNSSERRSFDVGQFTELALSHLSRDLREQGISLNVKCETALFMDGYPSEFGQAMTNLVGNAMAHAFPDERKGTVDVQVRATGSTIEICVADDGVGMALEVRRRAFDPFFTTRRHEGATGLGLHIAHHVVVNRLRGSMVLESTAGEGTRVVVNLPRSARPAED